MGHNFLKTALQMHPQESHSPIQTAYQYKYSESWLEHG